MSTVSITSVDALEDALRNASYFADRSLVVAMFLALELDKPLFLEGEAGVGKTEVAKVLARILGKPLVRLQCYEGLDISNAVYEWDYPRQMLEIRLLEASGGVDVAQAKRDIYRRDLLLARPLLQAIQPPDGIAPVLLIDELDRADEEFEAFLLELLSEFQITIPELGTLRADTPPVVVVTSNRTREVHDALRRRCLYHWIDYPSFRRELAIVEAKCPNASAQLSRQVVHFVQALRDKELYKRPGVAETLDWATALTTLDQQALDPLVVEETLGVVLKYQDDVELVRGEGAEDLVARAVAEPTRG